MFADEARFGRMNRPRPCWAPAGIRPKVASQLIREYIYLYGAVAPKDGTCVGHPLRRAQPRYRQINHLVPLYRKVILIRKWY
jgi:hypothetical protein